VLLWLTEQATSWRREGDCAASFAEVLIVTGYSMTFSPGDVCDRRSAGFDE
jgi:hypothetical protein